MEARVDFNKVLEVNLEMAKEAAKDMPEFDAAYFAGQIAGMLLGRNMAVQPEQEKPQQSA